MFQISRLLKRAGSRKSVKVVLATCMVIQAGCTGHHYWRGVPGWNHMGDWWVIVMMAILWILVIVAVVLLIRWLITINKPENGGAKGKPKQREDTPLDIIKTRYARGDISREEYEQLRRDLES